MVTVIDFITTYFNNYLAVHGWALLLINTGILLTGPIAIYFVNKPDQKTRRWGSVCGIIAQPLWFALAWYTDSFGLFILSLFYSYSWGKGFYYNWIRIKEENKKEMVISALRGLSNAELRQVEEEVRSTLQMRH